MRPDECCMLLSSFFSLETHSAHFHTNSHPLYFCFARYLSFGLYSDTNNFTDSSLVAPLLIFKTFDSIFLERGVYIILYECRAKWLRNDWFFFVWARVHYYTRIAYFNLFDAHSIDILCRQRPPSSRYAIRFRSRCVKCHIILWLFFWYFGFIRVNSFGSRAFLVAN